MKYFSYAMFTFSFLSSNLLSAVIQNFKCGPINMDEEDPSSLCSLLNQEFAEWRESYGEDNKIVLLDITRKEGGGAVVKVLVQGEHEVSLSCPAGYPHNEESIFVKLEGHGTGVSLWCNELNEFILDSSRKPSFSEVLSQGSKLHISTKTNSSDEEDKSDTDESIDSDSAPTEETFDVDPCSDSDHEGFTTGFELEIARKKKRWLAKEKELKEKLLRNSNDVVSAINLQDGEKSKTNQIFSDTASSGVLINDLVSIIKTQTETGISAEPIDDNIYTWSVHISNFLPKSELANDLLQVFQKYKYDYIQLELTFAVSVYPFYPPLVNVIRPLMKNSLMQRISNMENIKLSFWNPAKDMKTVLLEIKAFMQDWVRIEVDSERNDPERYPDGSYLHIEHHLLRLAQTSEVTPRANLLYTVEEEKLPKRLKTCKKAPVGKWKAGTGYGSGSTYAPHNSGTAWDVKAYLAAQKEKDKQELMRLIGCCAVVLDSSCDPMKQDDMLTGNRREENLVNRVYKILEGSCLLPFVKDYLNTDSILEISKHTVIFQKIFQIVDVIASHTTLVKLLGPLPEDDYSAFELLSRLRDKASEMLQRLHSACSVSQSNDQVFAETIIEAIDKVKGYIEHSEFKTAIMSSSKEVRTREDPVCVKETLYVEHLKPLQFLAINIPLSGENAHHYSRNAGIEACSNRKQVLRIAQELSSFKTSLPLNRSSSVFVRTGDNNISLMQAIITGPEGSPYSGGCYLFDIWFPYDYPNQPPKVNLQTTGRGKFRFNPNLYESGKVCLSLLGTWEGQEGEKWNAETSTILQVLVSIQSLILVPEPFFNEPGYERQIGTRNGEQSSRNYNIDVMINNVMLAMLEQIKNPPHGFEDVIKAHFFLKKDQILGECQEWLERYFAGHQKRGSMESAFQNLTRELKRLEPPGNVHPSANSPGQLL